MGLILCHRPDREARAAEEGAEARDARGARDPRCRAGAHRHGSQDRSRDAVPASRGGAAWPSCSSDFFATGYERALSLAAARHDVIPVHARRSARRRAARRGPGDASRISRRARASWSTPRAPRSAPTTPTRCARCASEQMQAVPQARPRSLRDPHRPALREAAPRPVRATGSEAPTVKRTAFVSALLVARRWQRARERTTRGAVARRGAGRRPGDGAWSTGTCIERIPEGKARPTLSETFPGKGTSGYAATLGSRGRARQGRDACLPSGFRIAARRRRGASPRACRLRAAGSRRRCGPEHRGQARWRARQEYGEDPLGAPAGKAGQKHAGAAAAADRHRARQRRGRHGVHRHPPHRRRRPHRQHARRQDPRKTRRPVPSARCGTPRSRWPSRR